MILVLGQRLDDIAGPRKEDLKKAEWKVGEQGKNTCCSDLVLFGD